MKHKRPSLLKRAVFDGYDYGVLLTYIEGSNRLLLDRQGFFIRRAEHPQHRAWRIPKARIHEDPNALFQQLIELAPIKLNETQSSFLDKLDQARRDCTRGAFTWGMRLRLAPLAAGGVLASGDYHPGVVAVYKRMHGRNLSQQRTAVCRHGPGQNPPRHRGPKNNQAAGTPIMIVYRLSLIINWEREIRAVDPEACICRQHFEADAQWVLVNYERPGDFMQTASRFAVLVIDETHRLKEPAALWTRHAFDIAAQVPYRYLLTGTSVLNRETALHCTSSSSQLIRGRYTKVPHLKGAPPTTAFGQNWTFVNDC